MLYFKAGISSGHLELRPEQVEQIFQPIVEGVISLLAGQVNNIRGQGLPIAAILLVGGFGTFAACVSIDS